uniref:Lipase domain-containing protein n=1 Tax=Macrostomum lignano TaxID=282301 RepID=A0A1I8GGJ9_9PLAT
DLYNPLAPAKVCYDDLGCFSTGGNFYDPKIRPVQLLPWSPDKVDPTYWLFTRSNILEASTIKYNDKASVTNSKFNPKNPTKIICHGWIESGDKPWVVEMKKALLSFGDFNANGVVYEQSTANTRMVGTMTARLIKWLETEFGADRENFHFIGHSLGSHIAGYTGAGLRESESKQLGRITGLDPAGPYFQGTDPEVRLDPTDARFVDAIHTDSSDQIDGHLFLKMMFDSGIGLVQPVGHIDFYPNGGKWQPGCTRNIFTQDILSMGIIEAGKWTLAACHHMRAPILFTATAANPDADFLAYECDNYDEFKAGRCLSCAGNKCARLGIRASEWKPEGRTFVKLSSSGFDKQTGSMTVTLIGKSSHTTAALTLLAEGNMEPGQGFQGLVTSPEPVVGVTGVRLSWKSNSWFNFFSKPKIMVDGVTVIEGINQRKSTYCGNGLSIESESSRSIPSC